MLKYMIKTYGCQMNIHESEKIAGILKKYGFEETDNIDEANAIVFNTCCIREGAETKIFSNIGAVKPIKKKKKNLIVAVMGCMTQQKKSAENLKAKFPWIDIIIGTYNSDEFESYFVKALKDKKKSFEVLDKELDIIENNDFYRTSGDNAWVNIMYGCNNYCTYCIVPYVRGRERSRNPEDIIAEAKEVAKQGYKEIMLLGQNVNSYLRSEMKAIKEGKLIDENGDYSEINSFAKLLREINKIEGIERIRFVSPHPKDFTDDVIEAIRDCDKVCKFVHLPLQSGSTNMLKVMNRKYTKEQYLSLVEKMKNQIPNIKFSTDIIVGFAGETEEDFEDTLDVVNKVKFEQVFMFIYSRRKGTPGDKMENQIPEEIKHKRFDRLKELVESQIAENNKQYMNTIQKVLVEGPSKADETMLTGRTEHNKVVVFKGEESLINTIQKIKITEDHMWYFKGEIVIDD